MTPGPQSKENDRSLRQAIAARLGQHNVAVSFTASHVIAGGVQQRISSFADSFDEAYLNMVHMIYEKAGRGVRCIPTRGLSTHGGTPSSTRYPTDITERSG